MYNSVSQQSILCIEMILLTKHMMVLYFTAGIYQKMMANSSKVMFALFEQQARFTAGDKKNWKPMLISSYQFPLQCSYLPRKTVERFDQHFHFMARICIFALLVHVVRLSCVI